MMQEEPQQESQCGFDQGAGYKRLELSIALRRTQRHLQTTKEERKTGKEQECAAYTVQK
jgi:hypothetical protein